MNDYLISNKITLEYDKTSKVYQTYTLYDKAKLWTIQDAINLVSGKSPVEMESELDEMFSNDNKKNYKSLLFFLGKEKVNEYCFSNKENNEIDIYLSCGDEFYEVKYNSSELWKFLNEEEYKEDKAYKPQEILEWLIRNTYIKSPTILNNVVFAENPEKIEELERINNYAHNDINQVSLGKTKYRMFLTKKDDQEILCIEETSKDRNNIILEHILYKDNPNHFRALFNGEQVKNDNKNSGIAKVIGNAFEQKIRDKELRSILKNNFFSIKAKSVKLVKKEIFI